MPNTRSLSLLIECILKYACIFLLFGFIRGRICKLFGEPVAFCHDFIYFMHGACHIFRHILIGNGHHIGIVFHFAQDRYADNILHFVSAILINIAEHFKKLFSFLLGAVFDNIKHFLRAHFLKKGFGQKFAVIGNVLLN